MPKRIKTDYPGVFYREVDRIGGKGTERMFYVVFKKAGKVIEAKAGGQYRHDMTPARAASYRSKLIEGKAELPKEKRAAEQAAKDAESSKWTVGKLYDAYRTAKPNLKGWAHGTYESLWRRHVEQEFSEKEPKDILPLDVKRVENRLLKTRSPQLVKHVLKLLRTLCNFGADSGLCPGLPFKMKMPSVNNCKTEDLDSGQLERLLDAIGKDDHVHAGDMMLMALYSGMRAGELMRLQWDHIDFERGFIRLVDPKGGVDQTIPLNDAARAVLEARPRTDAHVFPGRGGMQRSRIDKATRTIARAAGLPDSFRPLHGLRHVYASMLASSGKVDLYTLQRLLTHKSPTMTQRYAHLRDDALRAASNLAGELVNAATASKKN
jgi:integrase